ncbi:hypothetical protein I2485_07030 [Nesterenkonia sp. E16_7]|uniref:hypothetical protein n=1 Tax=unclassified Nesterenkonia TaxID=2629769 RepID=UPI001A91DE32|nr:MULTISPECIES: hypothetical protein [unclassified Nesterenkonia]MBO0596958.1 hypothetical protein [Nesterenkonia sp. E16_10]MBO0598404.1 hypothetical protein [Nesterenkonia sp. E16_7]
MSELTPAQQHVMDEAQRVNEERMAAVEDLAKAVARRVDLEHELAEAKKEEKRLMAAAERQGWTRAQVNRFAKPPKSAPRRTTSTDSDQARREDQASFSPDS